MKGKIGCIVKWFIVVYLSFPLYGKRAPDRPQWLVEKLRQFKLEKEEVSHFGNKSFYSDGRLRSWDMIDESVAPGSPEDIAKNFLLKHIREFGLKSDLSDIKLLKVEEFMKDIYRVDFLQTYKGIPVYEGGLHVIVEKNGKIRSAFSGYRVIKEDLDLSINISKESAIQTVINFLQIQGEITYGPVAELMIFPYKGQKLVYRVEIHTDFPLGGWEAFVDAKNGEIILLGDKFVYANGSGYIFNPDPITSAHTNYGGDFVDNNDNTNSSLDAQRFLITLKDIYKDDNTYYLKGPYVRIKNLGGYDDPIYSSNDGTFFYNRYDQAFEAVMVYYHIDNFQRYLQSLGFYYHLDTIYVDPHGTYSDNSRYDESLDAIYFGEGGVDDAEDADVIIHEYGHAIEERAMGGFNYYYSEAGALSEGYSDYMAGSYSAQINFYQKDWVFNWDGHNEFWQGRVLNSTKHYPEDMVYEPHKDGEIWSACLWKIFEQYGSGITDRIVMYSLWNLWSGSDFKDAAKKVLDADYWLYWGEHMNFIRNVFYNRGILRPPTVTVTFPNGGETFVQGSIERIKWYIEDFDGLTNSIELYYYYNNNYYFITEIFNPTQTYYDWLVPNISSPNIVKIKVVLKDKADNVLAEDMSNNPFTIVPQPPTNITYPNGGEILFVGSNVQITWNNSDPNNVISYVKLYYSVNGGANYTQINGNIQNTGSYTSGLFQISKQNKGK